MSTTIIHKYVAILLCMKYLVAAKMFNIAALKRIDNYGSM